MPPDKHHKMTFSEARDIMGKCKELETEYRDSDWLQSVALANGADDSKLKIMIYCKKKIGSKLQKEIEKLSEPYPIQIRDIGSVKPAKG